MGGSLIKFDAKKHLRFKEIKDTGKTKIWEIRNEHQSCSIGEIKWNGAWRKYCFFPYEDTMFDTNCLKTITEFLESAMENRKNNKNKGSK